MPLHGVLVCMHAYAYLALLQVPLLLVRHDGVIYPTAKTYTYEVDHLALLKQAHRQSLEQAQTQQLSHVASLNFTTFP